MGNENFTKFSWSFLLIEQFFELFSYVSMGINFACLTETDCSKFMIPRT